MQIQVLLLGGVDSLAFLAWTAKQMQVVRESDQVKKCRASSGHWRGKMSMGVRSGCCTGVCGSTLKVKRNFPSWVEHFTVVLVASSGENCYFS